MATNCGSPCTEINSAGFVRTWMSGTLPAAKSCLSASGGLSNVSTVLARLGHRLGQRRVDAGGRRPRPAQRRRRGPVAAHVGVVLAALLQQQRAGVDHALHARHAAGLERGFAVDQHQHRRSGAEDDVGRIVAHRQRRRRLGIDLGDRHRRFEHVQRHRQRRLGLELLAGQLQVLVLLRGRGRESWRRCSCRSVSTTARASLSISVRAWNCTTP